MCFVSVSEFMLARTAFYLYFFNTKLLLVEFVVTGGDKVCNFLN